MVKIWNQHCTYAVTSLAVMVIGLEHVWKHSHKTHLSIREKMKKKNIKLEVGGRVGGWWLGAQQVCFPIAKASLTATAVTFSSLCTFGSLLYFVSRNPPKHIAIVINHLLSYNVSRIR